MFPFKTSKKASKREYGAKEQSFSNTGPRETNDGCKVQVVKGRDMHQDFLAFVDHFCQKDNFDESNELYKAKRPRLAIHEERFPISKFTGTGFYTEHRVSTKHHFAVKRTEMRAYFRLMGK
jgi:hypothetical protein